MKPAEHARVKIHTAPTLSVPVGRCRVAVRGLPASSRRSAIRLNAMAALRAKTMHSRMPTNSIQNEPATLAAFASGIARYFLCHARAALNNANGRANSVWLNRIISRMRRTFCMAAFLGTPNARRARVGACVSFFNQGRQRAGEDQGFQRPRNVRADAR